MKIVYCINQLEHIGGTERITIAKANALSEIDGNEVSIVVAYNRKEKVILKILFFIDALFKKGTFYKKDFIYFGELNNGTFVKNEEYAFVIIKTIIIKITITIT